MKYTIMILSIFSYLSNALAQSDTSVYKNVDTEEAKELIKQKDVVLLDVRTPEETAQGVIEGAVEINLYDPEFKARVNALDKDKTYVVYCRSGRRSITACKTMADLGFEHLYNLKKGYSGWK